MTRISLSTAFVASLLASSALAAPPLKRASVPGNDNGACAATFGRCVKGVKKAGAHVFFDNPFGFSDQCTIAAVCYDANVDDFLYDVYRQVPHGRRHRPYSKTSPRLTQTQYNRIAYSPIHKRELEARALATQQNFVDYFYTTLSRSGGPYPDIDYVTNLWSEISAWTGFCDSRSIPYGNLADWFQYYSSSNYSPMCGATTSTSVTGGTTSVTGGTTTVNGGTTTVNSGTTTVVSGTTTVIGGTTSVIGGTTVTVTGTPVVSTFTTTQAGTTVTTTDASGNTVTTTASPTTVTVTTTATTTGTAATASPSNFVVTDGNGNPVGYLSTTGTITQNPDDALTPQSAGTSAKRQTTLIDLFSAGTNNFFCGRGGDLSNQTSYIEANGCPTSTGAGANHTALGYETTIFSIDPTGELSVFWVNNDGMTLPVRLTMGTHNGIPQKLLFVLDAAAPVFDGNVAGTPLTAKGQNVDEQASTFSSSMASSSSVPLASSAMSSMLSSVLPSGTDSSLLPSMTSLDMSATSVLPSTDSSLLASMTSLNMSATSILPSVTDSSLLPSVTSLNMSATSVLPSTSDVLSSSASESSSATASSSSSAPSPTASVLAAMDAAGNVVGYFSVDGTLTQDPNDALSPMAAQSSRSKRWNLFGNAKRETGQLVNLFSPNTNNYLCGIGEDLTDSNSIATGGCDETTFIGQTHEATGYETAIFSIVNGALQALWVNNNGTSIDPVIFTYGTFNNVSNTLLFVKNAAAPVFDNGASGATVTATAMPAPANDTTSSTDAGSSTSASIAPSSSAAEASSSKAAESSSSSAAEASSSSAAEASSSSAAEASSSSAEASSSSAAEVSSSSAEASSSSAAEASSSSAEASSSSAEVSSSSAAAASSSSAEASSSSAEASSSSAAEASSSSAEASSSSAEASSSSAEASSSSAEASSISAAEASSSSAAEASSTA